ncbi:MAG: hypothetical protein J6V42_06255 [Clostridia bacterium]|nr:hypothetical protein [Clostridia bacterium]
MSSSKYIFTLDLHSRVSQISLPCTVGDTDRSLVISFSDGGRAYQLPEGAWAMISIKRPSGTPVQVACHADATQVTYEFDKHTCVMAGIHDCQIALYNVEGKRIASPGFTLDVAPKYVDEDDEIIPDDPVSILESIVTGEAARVEAEKSRTAAEVGRSTSEVARAGSELARAKSENERAKSELKREEAEKIRAEAFALIEKKANGLVSPTVSVKDLGDKFEITVTDAKGTRTFYITQGLVPEKGKDYFTSDDISAMIKQVVETITRFHDGTYLGSWYFSEPLKNLSMLKAAVRYNFSFSCYINNAKEVKSFIGMERTQATAEHSLLRYYYRDREGNVIAYRTKYGEFSANSYQTITVESEPPDEIKALLDVNAIYVGTADIRLLDLENKVAEIEKKLSALGG